MYFRHKLRKKARNLPVKIDIVLKIYCWDFLVWSFWVSWRLFFYHCCQLREWFLMSFKWPMLALGGLRKKIKKHGRGSKKKWGIPQADARISLKSLLANFSWKTIPVFIWKWMAWVQFNFYLMNLQVVAHNKTNHISISNSLGGFS